MRRGARLAGVSCARAQHTVEYADIQGDREVDLNTAIGRAYDVTAPPPAEPRPTASSRSGSVSSLRRRAHGGRGDAGPVRGDNGGTAEAFGVQRQNVV